jgi:hypothetical protein
VPNERREDRVQGRRQLAFHHHPVEQPAEQAASQHLAVLSKAGLVEARREGTKALYSIKPDGFAPVAAFVEDFWVPKLAALKQVLEKKR